MGLVWYGTVSFLYVLQCRDTNPVQWCSAVRVVLVVGTSCFGHEWLWCLDGCVRMALFALLMASEARVVLLVTWKLQAEPAEPFFEPKRQKFKELTMRRAGG